MPGRILPLDIETQSRLRSTQILTSVPQIVSELVQNSLDANATHIEIGINADEWECYVKDDGIGMSKADMRALAQGSTQGRYSSSKAYQISTLDYISTFGFRGEALASAADLSCLEISSRVKASSGSWSLILKGGRQLHYGPAIRWRSNTTGTVVVVRDAFYNLPVRRKTHPSASKTIENIKKDIKSFALVFPQVVFTLEDTSASRNKLLSIAKTATTLGAFRAIYGRALVEHVDIIDKTSSGIHLEGFISLEGATSRAFQFLYLNARLLDPSELHHVIEAQFAKSTFGRHAFGDEGATSERSTTRRSPRKGEKRPVYVLQLSVSRSVVDLPLEPSKTADQNMETVKDLLETCIRAFLRRNSFMSSSIAQEQPDREVKKNASLVEDEDGMEERVPQQANFIGLNNGYSSLHRVKHYLHCETTAPTWIQTMLRNWENPVVKQDESRAASSVASEVRDIIQDVQNRRMLTDQHAGHTVRPSITFTANDLSRSEVLAQVDRKFVACIAKHHGDEMPILILVDQHAADERIRVERYLREYCEGACDFSLNEEGAGNGESSIRLSYLTPPKHVLLTRHEVVLLQREEVRLEICRWGIILDGLPASDIFGDRVQVSVSAVPILLQEKLLKGNELQETLKNMLGEIDTNGVPQWGHGTAEEKFAGSRWLRSWRNCPLALRDLIDSKACRGAIMFNDPLSDAQCARLIKQLSTTSFPFQCAHSRPSIAPLLSLAGLGEEKRGRRGIDWNAFVSSNDIPRSCT